MVEASRPARSNHPLLRQGRYLLLNIVLPAVLAVAGAQYLHRYVYRKDIRGTVAEHNSFGPVELQLTLPATHAGVAEPLIVCGNAGNASLMFIKLLADGRGRIGIEFWGRELTEGDEFDLPPPGSEVTLRCELPAFYPDVGSSKWRNIPSDQQQALKRHYRVAVDGIVRLTGVTDYAEPLHAPIYLGANPLGGSFVSDRFSGTILSHAQGF
jgi:hypothetical protein